MHPLCERHQLPKDAIVTCYATKLTEEAVSNSAYLQSQGELPSCCVTNIFAQGTKYFWYICSGSLSSMTMNT